MFLMSLVVNFMLDSLLNKFYTVFHLISKLFTKINKLMLLEEYKFSILMFNYFVDHIF